MKNKIIWFFLRDCGYYPSYGRCPNRWEKFKRWCGFRIGLLPNRWRPHHEHQPVLPEGRDWGTLVPTTDSSGIGGSGLRNINPGELIP